VDKETDSNKCGIPPLERTLLRELTLKLDGLYWPLQTLLLIKSRFSNSFAFTLPFLMDMLTWPKACN